MSRKRKIKHLKKNTDCERNIYNKLIFFMNNCENEII